MPYKKVPLITNEIYHIYSRGVDTRTIFCNEADYKRFYYSLQLFNTVEPIINFQQAYIHRHDSNKQLVDIHAYALVGNRFHLLIKQVIEDGITEFMRRVSVGYAGYFNEKNERSGALFQGRFKRVHVVSEEQYQYLFAYINENHTVHDVAVPQHIWYTSSLHYTGKKRSVLMPDSVTKHTSAYNAREAARLAQSIYKKRRFNAACLLE